MISATKFRRARWLGSFAMLVLTASSLKADENPAAAAPPAQEAKPQSLGVFFGGVMHVPLYHLDMHLAPVPKVLDEQLELKGEGVLVVQVGPDGPAAKAGIQAHDVVLAVGDTPIKGPSNLMDAIDKSEGKELSLKLMRAGKPLTVAVTPASRTAGILHNLRPLGPEAMKEIRDLQSKIRERLKEAGMDLRMEVFQPGRMLSEEPGGMERRSEFPDDLSVTLHKQGKNPAEIEVKQGDQTWTVKENELAQLPEEVRKHVEVLLNRRAVRIHLLPRFADGRPGLTVESDRIELFPPSADGPPQNGPGAPPGPRGVPRRPHGPPPRPEEGPHAGPQGGPDGPGDRGPQLERRDDQRGHRSKGTLERRLSEVNREMHRLHEQIEELRRGLREDRQPEDDEETDSPQP